MSRHAILAWPPLLRPPASPQKRLDDTGALDVPLKAVSCRNQIVSVIALVTAEEPVRAAGLVFSDLTCDGDTIPAAGIRTRLIGTVRTPEKGLVCDPLYDVDEFRLGKRAFAHSNITVPKGIRAGTYRGSVSLEAGGKTLARNDVEVEVADVDLPDARDWSFFLNVWMNPGRVASWHGVEIWSEEHFKLMRPYVEDLASHGQKTALMPICYQPWGTQTRDPFPNAIAWTRRKGKFEFDFTAFDRCVKLHEQCGIDRAIHCYSIVSGPGKGGSVTIDYFDADAGEQKRCPADVGSPEYVEAWGPFFAAFEKHLRSKGWFEKTYIAFDEKPPEAMERMFEFLARYAPAFKTSLAGNTSDELVTRFDDLCLHIHFNDQGVAESAPPERSSTGVAALLDPEAPRAKKSDEFITTYYVCCGPAFPNTFLFSPLVESRMLPLLSVQGGFDGFLRWSYNDWPDDPFKHPEWGTWPTGDVMFVYPGKNGPVSSLRWEQLREGICDYELAMIASANLRTPEEMVDYEQAVVLACRNPNGAAKSLGDIELARRLLIPIAEHAGE